MCVVQMEIQEASVRRAVVRDAREAFFFATSSGTAMFDGVETGHRVKTPLNHPYTRSNNTTSGRLSPLAAPLSPR